MGLASSVNNVGSQAIGVTAAFFGAIGATFVCSFDLTRVGSLVFMNPRDSSIIVSDTAAGGATNSIVATGVIPSAFQPTGATTCAFECKVINNSVEGVGFMLLLEDGGLLIQRDLSGTNFGITNDNGFIPPTVFWKS